MRELTINGILYSEEELVKHCNSQLLISDFQWERDVYSFILEWLDAKESISAKTSGSTGKPKAMELSKKRMLNSAQLTGEYFKFEKGQTALLCLSTNFIAGKMMVVRAFLWQLNLILVNPNGHPLGNLQLKIDFAAMVPLQVINCIKEGVDFTLVSNLLIGGGAVDAQLEEQLQELPTRCFSSYGMTETVSHVAIKPLNGDKKSDFYEGLGNVTFSLDERSCLQIEAPEVLSGSICTNDVVNLIDGKHFIWLGRYDNVINSGGVKLFPEQIEEKLKDAISDPFFIAGVADQLLGQKLVLVIEKENQSAGYRSNLLAKIKGLLGKYEQARDVIFIPKFKRTPNGKLQREATMSLLK
ncbi:AMP-binding protein [Labilibaculum sp. K2S]|uniref:AMP-binding protein n=1 Tax=Labilibaculum sp. K2S TaxID=3056386 RepID=UPI0025A4323D|nr:AMP-binding protein [Labilibaculum sp. K2S]MDM8159817.1 AMP-binding protein [Labilibaculum sp. K2S]